MGAFRKKALLRSGLFDENFVRHQDYELNYRIRKTGGKIFLSPNIRSIYYVRSTIKTLLKQYFQYGYWKGRLLRRSPGSLKWRHLVPPVFVLMLLFGMISAVWSVESRMLISFLLGIYALFSIIATLVSARTGNVKYIPILPLIFAVIHLSWGIGAWFGLLSPKLPPPKEKLMN
jgi:GT2 family glycosyltransferase